MEKAEYLCETVMKLESICKLLAAPVLWKKGKSKKKKKALLIVPLEYVFIENIYCQWFNLFMKEFMLLWSTSV